MTSSWPLLYFGVNVCRRLTLIQPVSQAVEDNSLLASGHEADRSALYRRFVVDVVFEYEELDREMQTSGYR